MTLPITSLYAAILGLFALVLATLVIIRRARSGISILHGADTDLAVSIRRHGNFVEYVPLALILMGLCEMRGLSALWLQTAGVGLVAARLAHALGLTAANASHPLRILGGSVTQIIMAVLALYLLIATFH
jgi:uncharacterized membrane protein YecN with MAPEG domain